ncbi:MAG: hypothetical protein ACK5KL_04575 [Dysgonomonas sp.]
MKKIIFFLLLYYCTNIYGQDSTLLAEIDFLKEEPSAILSIGLIQNVQTDWGKLGLRGKVKILIEYTGDKTNITKTVYNFNESGRLTSIGINDSFKKHYWYSEIGQLISETIGSDISAKYEYRKEKLKNAVYQNGIVTSYGDKHLNLVYNERGQIISSHHLHEDISATYNYNDNGQLAEKKFSKEVGNKQLEISTAVEYNDKDDIEKKFSKYVTVNQTDTSFQVEMYKYEYDLYNNWVKREHRGTGPVIHTQRSIYYYDGTYSGDNALISNPDHILYTRIILRRASKQLF